MADVRKIRFEKLAVGLIVNGWNEARIFRRLVKGKRVFLSRCSGVLEIRKDLINLKIMLAIFE